MQISETAVFVLCLGGAYCHVPTHFLVPLAKIQRVNQELPCMPFTRLNSIELSTPIGPLAHSGGSNFAFAQMQMRILRTTTTREKLV